MREPCVICGIDKSVHWEVPGDHDWTDTRASRPLPRVLPRYKPCAKCGREPAAHNPHPLNAAYVGHEYE